MAAAHFIYVATAYGFAGFMLTVLLVWIALDYRAQQRQLSELEAQRAKKN